MMIKILIALFLTTPFFSYAQESDGSQENISTRPSMPALFFTPEQRRQLEIVRGGEFDDLNISSEFIPTLFTQNILEDSSNEPLAALDLSNEKGQGFSFDSYVINKNNNTSFYWLNNKIIENKSSNNTKEFSEINFNNKKLFIKTRDGKEDYVLSVGQKIINKNVAEKYPIIVVNQ